jgi:uncharacterized lipoprotein YmbA
MNRVGPAVLLFPVLSAMLAGCGGTSAEPHFYTLSMSGTILPHTTDASLKGIRIAVGPVTVPQTVDRPELVVRVSANEIALAEQHRWAQPLRNEIARAIAENLEQLLAGSQVVSYPTLASRKVDYRVVLDLQRFDSILGQTVTVDALWSISDEAGGGETVSGRSLTQEPTRAPSYQALVAAHTAALAKISAEIAETMKKASAKRNSKG